MFIFIKRICFVNLQCIKLLGEVLHFFSDSEDLGVEVRTDNVQGETFMKVSKTNN